MEQRTRSDTLLVWCLATFHTIAFFLVLILVLFLNGRLGEFLATLNTAVGLAIFGALWLSNWWCTRRALRGINWAALSRPAAHPMILGRGTVWGGINGIIFLALVLAGAIAGTLPGALATEGISFLGRAFLGIILGFPFLSIFAFIVGAIVGLVLALLDSFVLGITLHLFRSSTTPKPLDQTLAGPESTRDQRVTLRMFDHLLTDVPELRNEFEAAVDGRWATAQEIKYSDFLGPRLEHFLQSGQDPDILQRIFGVLEAQVQQPDETVRTLGPGFVIQRFLRDETLTTKARLFMGEGTQRLADEVEEYVETVDLLFEVVPALREESEYKDLLAECDGEKPGPYIVFEDVLNPYLERILRSGGLEEELQIHQIFEFLERLAGYANPYIRDLVAIAEVEWLHAGGEGLLKLAWPYMDENLRRMSHEYKGQVE